MILKHTDLPQSEVQFSNPQGRSFVNFLKFPLPLKRGWGSVDVTVGGKTFQFITTHLEPESDTIRLAQANEILSSLASTKLPVILAGDFNLALNDPAGRTDTATYSALLEAKFVDVWIATKQKELGNTCCHAPDLLDAAPLTHRDDLVLFRGGLRAFGAKVIGDELSDRTPSGLWPSDHAGVAGELRAK